MIDGMAMVDDVKWSADDHCVVSDCGDATVETVKDLLALIMDRICYSEVKFDLAGLIMALELKSWVSVEAAVCAFEGPASYLCAVKAHEDCVKTVCGETWTDRGPVENSVHVMSSD